MFAVINNANMHGLVIRPNKINLFSPLIFRKRRSSSTIMADLTINSKYALASGHKIPVLGYGVCLTRFAFNPEAPSDGTHCCNIRGDDQNLV